jgi:hypothetical protein
MSHTQIPSATRDLPHGLEFHGVPDGGEPYEQLLVLSATVGVNDVRTFYLGLNPDAHRAVGQKYVWVDRLRLAHVFHDIRDAGQVLRELQEHDRLHRPTEQPQFQHTALVRIKELLPAAGYVSEQYIHNRLLYSPEN